jgi:cobalt-zinc-cadmium efflux system outer membrane protein
MTHTILWFTLLFFLSLGFGSPSAAAQGAKGQGPIAAGLTLVEAIERALVHNRGLAVVRSEAEVSRGRLQQARIYPHNPELIIEGDSGRGTGRENPALGGNEKRDIWGGRVGIGQVVEIRGQRALRTRLAEFETVRADWEVRDTEREVVAATMRAFSDLLLAQERVALTRELMDLITQLKTAAEDLGRAGAVPELDALRAEVERRRAANRLILEEVSAAAAARSFAMIIGAPANVSLRVVGLLLFDPLKGKPEELAAAARSVRPDLKAAEAALESAAAALRLVRSESLLPSVTVSATYARGADWDAYYERGMVGLSVPLPLVNRREGDIAAAEAAVRKAEAQRSRTLAAIEKEVATALEQYEATRRVVREYAERIVTAQEENLRLIQEGYRLGEFRLTEVLLTQRDLFETKASYLEAIAAYNRSLAEIYGSTGVRP